MAPSPQKKIPDMFLRALKRKANAAAPASSVGECEKKLKVDKNEVTCCRFACETREVAKHFLHGSVVL